MRPQFAMREFAPDNLFNAQNCLGISKVKETTPVLTFNEFSPNADKKQYLQSGLRLRKKGSSSTSRF